MRGRRGRRGGAGGGIRKRCSLGYDSRTSGYRRCAPTATTDIRAAIPPTAKAAVVFRVIHPATNDPLGFIPRYPCTYTDITRPSDAPVTQDCSSHVISAFFVLAGGGALLTVDETGQCDGE